jgi:hypothetical protein
VVSASLSARLQPEPGQLYLFAANDCEIRMTLEFYDRYESGLLEFHERSTDHNYCLSTQGEENRNCISGFHGAIAVARYRISSPVRSPSLRECVRSIDQSDRLAVRPPVERTIRFQHGLASDIQVFGYQESSSSQDAHPADPDDAWCLLRQDLYLALDERAEKPTPFLVLHWKHTLNSIRVLDIIPVNGARLVRSAGKRSR